MDRSGSLDVTPKLVLGVLVLALGVIFTLDNLGVVAAGDILQYWPVGLVALGIAKVLQPYGRGFGVALMLVGAWLLLERLDVIPWSLWDLWPLILVAIGATLIWRTVAPRARRAVSSTGPELNVAAILGGAEPRITAENFRGGDVLAIMGSCKVDLREAKAAPEGATIDTFAFWGGIEILVPEKWSVEIRGTPILGGFEDKTRGGSMDGSQRLTVTGMAIMGGVEVKN